MYIACFCAFRYALIINRIPKRRKNNSKNLHEKFGNMVLNPLSLHPLWERNTPQSKVLKMMLKNFSEKFGKYKKRSYFCNCFPHRKNGRKVDRFGHAIGKVKTRFWKIFQKFLSKNLESSKKGFTFATAFRNKFESKRSREEIWRNNVLWRYWAAKFYPLFSIREISKQYLWDLS